MYVQSDEEATAFLRNNGSMNLTDEIFTDNKIEAIQKFARYTNVLLSLLSGTKNTNKLVDVSKK